MSHSHKTTLPVRPVACHDAAAAPGSPAFRESPKPRERTMARDSYRDFADVYDAWQMLYPRAFSLAIAPRVIAAMKEHVVPNTVLADLACGTGIFPLWWQKTHPSWTVYGTDLSPAMIAAAKRAAKKSVMQTGKPSSLGRGRRVPTLLVQDMRRFGLPEPAGVVTCLFDSLNHLTREADLAKTFRAVTRSLAPRGLFLFDLVDELAFPEVFTGTSILDGKDLYVGIDTSYREERGHGIGEAKFTFFRRHRSAWRRVEFSIRERCGFRGAVREMLTQAGLDLVRLDRIDPYRSAEFFVPRTFWVCRRGRG
jgi:SAM-dependent methyltransferase